MRTDGANVLVNKYGIKTTSIVKSQLYAQKLITGSWVMMVLYAYNYLKVVMLTPVNSV